MIDENSPMTTFSGDGFHLVPPVLDVLTRRPDSGGLPHLLALKSLEMLTTFNYTTPLASFVGM